MFSKKNISQNKSTTIAEFILDYFFKYGVTTLFVVPGLHVDNFLTHAIKDGRFRIIKAAHEQGAAYMADGFARITGGPAVVITINGPGATNLITAAVTASIDSIPIIFLTGDSPSAFNKLDAFQSSVSEGADTNAILCKALKNSFQISSPETLSAAFNLFEDNLYSISPSPIHINLPCEIANQVFAANKYIPPVKCSTRAESAEKPKWLRKIPSKPGNRIAMFVGEEIKNIEDIKAIVDFSKKCYIPVASTMGAKNIQSFLPEDLYLGVFGYAGCARAYEALLAPELKCLIVFGAKLNERNTAAWHPKFFNNNRTIIRFTCNTEINTKYTVPVIEISERPSKAIPLLLNYWKENTDATTDGYLNRVAMYNKLLSIPRIPVHKTDDSRKFKTHMSMTEITSVMNAMQPSDAALFLDSGDHRIYGGTFWEVKSHNSFFTASKTAPMGWAIAAAIGASFAKGDKPVWVLTGDGCMLMHGMEIAIAAKHKCRVTFLVSNNGAYGRIASRLKDKPDELVKTLSSLPQISWADFANSLGVSSCRVSEIGKLEDAINKAKKCNGPFLIEMMTGYDDEIPYPPSIFSSLLPPNI